MYVSYLLDKKGNMYSNSVRHPGLNLNPQNFVPPPPPPPPQYADFAGYHHHVAGISSDPHHPQHPGTWGPPYVPPREDWHGYGVVAPSLSSSGPQPTFAAPDFTSVQPQASGAILPSVSSMMPPLSPNSPKQNPYSWVRQTGVPVSSRLTIWANGKTRTKDKYRVVYTDHQRQELEKEFHYSRYITIRRKTELALSLGLSERQVKIWFQNRRAKERKINKKKIQQHASSTTSSPRTLPTAGLVCSSLGPPAIPLNIKEEYLS
ncbi:homeobox protein CDX-1-like [Narcine bancroftii]|uniref:homeobox protein CDX-1-like n=1 Tax=Narcine bancroftii TaxID=1343680 RepID=UPI003831E8FD